MKIPFLLLLISQLLLPVACSSINQSDCKRDMLTFGREHGAKGLIKLTDEIQKVCQNYEPHVDLEKYENGFNQGWAQYCTPLSGFENGRKGDLYKSFCPVDKEEIFREKYLIGKKIFEKNDLEIELEDKIKSLSSSGELDLAAKSELSKLKEVLINLKREIQRLEQNGRKPIHTSID